MAELTKAEKTFIERRHHVISDRALQLGYNMALMHGGQPYIDSRLTRFPYESEASWSGNPSTGAKGRKDRAFFTNYAGRVVRKITQFAFGGEVSREGIDPEFASDATKTMVPIDGLMQDLSNMLTAARWGWLQVDRGAASVDEQTNTVRPQSVAEREARGDRIFWSLWDPLGVVDWSFNARGDLQWLITEERVLRNDDPFEEATSDWIRTLWLPGKGERWFLDEAKSKVLRKAPFTLSAPIIPFIPCGRVTRDPWWFDEVEKLQAALLNLESVSHENIFQTVYPQTVLPASIFSEGGGADGNAKTPGDIVKRVGLKYPIVETAEEKGITRYVMPPADSLKLIPEEIQRRKRELYDVVGMAMSVPESRQVASAEAKRWDHMDPEAVLKERAGQLQTIEAKAIAYSQQLDSTFKPYVPSYPMKFDMSDPKEDFRSLIEVSAIEIPPLARREIQRVAVRLLDKVSPIAPDRMKLILDEIDSSDEPGDPLIQQPRGSAAPAP